MSQIGAGKDILSYCNKCKLALSHVIVVMKDELTPGKVQCNTCRNVHQFKDPSTVKKKTTRKKSTRKAAVPISEIWSKQMSENKNKSIKYTPQTTFAKGDILDHPSFGPGIVEKNIDSNKIEVLFENSIKMLVHNLDG